MARREIWSPRRTKQMTTVENVVLTDDSRKRLSKIPYWSFGNVADSIEFATSWSVPEDVHEYSDLRDVLEKGLADFFSLEDPSAVKIKRFETNILSFEKGIYPDYDDERPRKRKKSGKPSVKPKSGNAKSNRNPSGKSRRRTA